jgi:hypothetical protein
MQTHADSATALGMPPGRVETPASVGAFGNSNTHYQVDCPPGMIREDDIFPAAPGDYRTVAQLFNLSSGETLIYFRHPHEGEQYRATVPETMVEVTVYRPWRVTA